MTDISEGEVNNEQIHEVHLFKHPTVSFNFTSTIDVECGRKEIVERFKSLLDLKGDVASINPMLERVFGPGAVRQRNLIGGREFGTGTNYYKSVLFGFQGDTQTKISFSLHSMTPHFRRQHTADIETLLRQVSEDAVGGSSVKWEISVDMAGFPLRKINWIHSLRAYSWVLLTGSLTSVPFAILKDWGTTLITVGVAAIIYCILVLVEVRRGSYVLEIE